MILATRSFAVACVFSVVALTQPVVCQEAESSLAAATESHASVVEPGAAAPEASTAAEAGSASAEDSDPKAPAPTSLLLVGTGLIALAMSSRRWRRTLVKV